MMTAYGTGWSSRVPPSLASSAITPWPRLATSSINAGGHDHSRPTSKPTFFTGDPLIVPADVHRQHALPHGPVVRHTVPQSQCVADTLRPQRVRQPLVAVLKSVVSSDGEDDIEMAISPGVLLAGDEVDRVVEVDGVAVIAVGEAANIT